MARIGLQVAQAIDYANRLGVLHRDIKPSNLLLDAMSNVWVADFGLAKMTEADDMTQTGQLVGTIRYMAPERFQGQCDARSDVYSLGLTLYELVALRPAYEASDRHELMERVRLSEPAPLKTLAPRVPRDLETIISKAIAREPDRRYATGARAGRRPETVPRRASNPGATGLASGACRSLVPALPVGGGISRNVDDRSHPQHLAGRSPRSPNAWLNWPRSRPVSNGTAPNRKRQPRRHSMNSSKGTCCRKPAPTSRRDRPPNRTPISKSGPHWIVRPKRSASISPISQSSRPRSGTQSVRRITTSAFIPKPCGISSMPHEIRRRHLGADHPATLDTEQVIGTVYMADGKLSEAEPFLLRAMNGFRTVRGAEDQLTLAATHTVAQLHSRAGKTA